jgi:hypothetical protein
MSDCADSARRLREIAAILATGVLRLRHNPSQSAENAEKNPLKVSPDGLELSPETRLSVRAVNDL